MGAISVATKLSKWTEIAVELGYSDQAHFINDFKRIIGQTPGEYARQALSD